MKKLALAGCLLLLPILVSQWASPEHSGELRFWTVSHTTDEILVGVAWPFSINQDGFAEGLTLAQEEINRRGVRGRQIRLQMRDDHLDREESRRISMDFASNPHMSAVLGYYDDSFAVRASAIFEASGLLHIITGANNTYMTTRGFQYLVRATLPSNKIARQVAGLCQARGYRKYALVWEEENFGEDLAYQLANELDAVDAHVVYNASYFREHYDFRRTVDELKATHADAIFFAGLEEWAAHFIRTAREMGLKTPIIGAFSDTPAMHEIAGPALEGAMFYDLYDVNSPTPKNRAFAASYRKRFGKAPETYSATGYDALHALARAVELTGAANPLDLAYTLRYMDPLEGANGPYDFDINGELETGNVYLKMYRGGVPVTVASSSVTAVPSGQ